MSTSSNRRAVTADRASRLLTALLALLLAGAPVAAQTINQNIGGGISFTFDGGISGKVAAAAPPVSGALLLEDNVSILLLEDGASSLCLEGGC